MSLICAYLSLLIFLIRDRRARRKFTVDESQIENLADIYGNLEPPLGVKKQNLILLPQFLSKVSDDFASGKMLKNLLRIVHKYPLLEDDYSKSDELSSLYQQVNIAAEKYLGPYSRVSVGFYMMRIPLIQIRNFRYAA